LREKASIDAIKAIPVVMITTEAGSDVISEARSLGAVGSIKKPFTPDQISETVGSLF
jgi:two-component system chemotaxis response regulator CheY